MDNPLITIASMLGGYLLGSVLGAYWICRLLHLPDPSSRGSGNPGATNLYRIGGPIPAALTLSWDALKGTLGVALATSLSDQPTTHILAALATVLGHMLPVFHRFRGGKGVATAMGCGLFMAPATTLMLVAVWSAMLYWKKVSSLASLVCAALAPWLAWWLDPEALLLFLVLALFLFVRHRDNILRLTRRQEPPLR